MTEKRPVPSAQWGAWRNQPVTIAGKKVLPASSVTPAERKKIDSRLIKDYDRDRNDS